MNSEAKIVRGFETKAMLNSATNVLADSAAALSTDGIVETTDSSVEIPAVELYVHIPFCVKKCDYCDFLSGPASREGQEIYVSALIREMELAKEEIPGQVSTVFIGGGTPSLLPPDLMEKILGALRRNFVISPDAEFTMEANPGTLDSGKLKLYREYGVNRLSLGLQSPKDRELRLLGRIHDYCQFLESYGLAREAGFTNINIDLMSAIPDQTRDGWAENLRTVAALRPEHISAYSLIIEEGTPFAERKLSLPDEDTEYEMYEDTARILQEYGYSQYEISNYARPGYVCCHNLGYWERTPYLGLGLGAASLLYENNITEQPNLRFSNTRSMKDYVSAGQTPDFLDKIRENREILSIEDQMSEFMFLGLRKTAGISRTEFEKCFGKNIESVYGSVIEKYKKLALLDDRNDRLALTRAGIHVSNAVMADFLL